MADFQGSTSGNRVWHGDAAAAYAQGVADGAEAGRKRWMAALAEHYLMGINFDPDTKRSNPMCGCSRIHLGWYPSLDEARQAWTEHVAARLHEEGRQS